MANDTNQEFQAAGELAKELGLKEALAIGVGTMVGAGIFVLPRFAIEMVGPGAILTYILAGVICIITASSLAEIATGMPKSGGIYFFLSRSLGTLAGTISGLSLWLSLTFAVAFYLLGFGEYMALFLPINETILAAAAGIFFTYINYIGAKETGKTQNIIVGILVTILSAYIVWGFINVDRTLWTPFLPEGAGAVLPATAVIFVSFLGFAQIASVAEEIKDPGNNLPKAIMGSVAIVTMIYVPVILVVTGVLPIPDLVLLDTPVVDVARIISGAFGAVAVTIAALLATASSANASIMASSRINFAMGRDHILPDWFNKVHPEYLTPYRPIIATGLLALVMLVTADVEALSSSASVLMLINYAIINLVVLLLRKEPPKDYNPSYRAFGSPYLQIIAAAASIAIIVGASNFAKLSALALVALSVAWFLAWSKNKASIKAAISDLDFGAILKREPAPAGTSSSTSSRDKKLTSGGRLKSLPGGLHVLAPLANPEGESALLNLSGKLVSNSPQVGEITALNIFEVPSQSPLNLIQQDDEVTRKARDIQRSIMRVAINFGEENNILINPRVVYSHDKYKT
ncbi:MAG: APC family permease, partial [Halarsenatibacteraceae bacterium]